MFLQPVAGRHRAPVRLELQDALDLDRDHRRLGPGRSSGLSYYARRAIGANRWRKLHRFTALAWIAGIVHTLGEGTDAGQLWFLAMLAIVAVPAVLLLAVRYLTDEAPRPTAGSEDTEPPRPPAGASGPAPGTRRGRRPIPASPSLLQAGRVADHEAGELAAAPRPAGPALGQRDGVKAPAGDLHPDVAGVGVDRDPPSRAGLAPVLEVAGDHRRADQARPPPARS